MMTTQLPLLWALVVPLLQLAWAFHPLPPLLSPLSRSFRLVQQCSTSSSSSSTDPTAATTSPSTANAKVIHIGSDDGASTTFECQFCQELFVSRNALFRHLKSDRVCSQQANHGASESKPHSLALQFSYYNNNHHHHDNNNMEDEEASVVESEAQIAGRFLQQSIPMAIQDYLQEFFSSKKKDNDDDDREPIMVTILGSSQSSLARLRHAALDQEVGCYAAGDALVIRLQGPYALDLILSPPIMSSSSDDDDDEDGSVVQKHHQQQQRHFLKYIMERTNELLLGLQTPSSLMVQLEACKILAPSGRQKNLVHGEQSCTQRVYHYAMPLRWLPDGLALEEWWIRSAVPVEGSHTNKSTERQPSESLKGMKAILRSAESERLDRSNLEETKEENAKEEEEEDDNSNSSSISVAEAEDDDENRKAGGRFGALGEKKRRAWHNFADPQLKGSASPNTKPVWRVLDKGRFQELLTKDRPRGSTAAATEATLKERTEKEVVAILEFRGDDFLPQQIRRLVGTTLAMTHGWLPPTTLDIATRADCFLETPLAPPGRLYLVDNRFHWNEMRTKGQPIFESDIDGVAISRTTSTTQGKYASTAVQTIQSSILDACDNDSVRESEDQWLSELQETVCPRIQSSLDEWRKSKTMSETTIPTDLEPVEGLTPPPEEYQRTLHLLREIIATGQWPETSVARSSVIGNVARGGSDGTVHKKGSFSVINPQFQNGIYKTGVGKDRLPLGNQLFPELVEAVFDLEQQLSSTDLQQAEGKPAVVPRPASSHCAINCNAQFTPHVDSGRGAGQSLSMIVGLGDYVGGELGVEGVGHDIRYQPLEFDGWRLRHWTKAFEGERYSLVWFTPEMKGDEKSAGSLDGEIG